MIRTNFVNSVYVFFFLFGLGIHQVFAASLYLPLNDPLMPWVERAASISNLSNLKKPYRISDIEKASYILKKDYPNLAHYLRQQLGIRFNQTQFNTFSLSTTLSSEPKATLNQLPNQYDSPVSSNLAISTTAIFNNFAFIKGLADFDLVQTANQSSLTSNNAYLALGNNELQLDIGYRDHWLSANTFNGLLYSNNAPNAPSISLSNPTAWTQAGIQFEWFVSQLALHKGIRLDQTQSDGNPYLSGIQLSFQPIPEWGMSFNRSFMFGGGDRTVTFNDYLEAFFDPRSKDNVGLGKCSGSSPNCEFGNQQMAMESQLKVRFNDFPVVINTALAAEDTERGSPLYIGNVLMSLGLTLPYLTDSQSLNMQYSEWEAGWYTHHIYPDGYTNEGAIMGAYWASTQAQYVGFPGNEIALEWQNFITPTELLGLTYRLVTTTPLIQGQKTTRYAHLAMIKVQGINLPKTAAKLKANLFLGRSIENKYWGGLMVGVDF